MEMPRSRYERRKECELIVPEIYCEEASRTGDDPKALLNGLSIAALVTLLRQFGDLSKYAAEVFHGLQEQVSTTSSRSRKLMTRMKHVEAAILPLESAMLSQRSHLQFAYTPGFEWHVCIEDERNHFLYTDLPHCLMDSYDECREPPRLQLLDRFDPGGPGSCLKRYSDPTFVRKISRNSDVLNDEKCNKERKARETKKRSRKQSSCQLPYDASNFDFTDKVQSYSPRQLHQSSPTQTASTLDNALQFDFAEQSSTFTWDGSVEIVGPMVLNYGMQELPSLNATSSEFGRQEIEPRTWKVGNDEVQKVHEPKFHLVDAQSVEPTLGRNSCGNRNPDAPESNLQDNDQVKELDNEESPDVTCTSFAGVDSPSLISYTNQPDGTESDTENFVDALNTIESDCENDLDCEAKKNDKLCSYPKDDLEDGVDTERIADSSYNGSGKGKFNSLRCSTSSLLLSHEDSLQRTSASLDVSGNAPRRSIQSSFESLNSSAYPSEDTPRQSIQSSVVQNVSAGVGLSVHVDNADDFQQNSSVGEFSSSEFEVTRLINGIDEGLFHAPYLSEQTSVRETKAHCAADVRNKLDGESSCLSGFLHRGQINGFRRARSMEYNEKPKAVSCEKICDHKNRKHATSHCSFSRIRLTGERPSFMTSDPASPPVKHMQISFQPINSLETSKLKLQQPEVTDHHSETLDSFPSFQMVPEPNLQPQFYSDNDDDTFHRSNHSISDDDINHHSGPKSELWDSPDSSQSRHHIPCKTFCRTSSGGSISSSAVNDQTTNRSIQNGFGSSRAQNMVDVLLTNSSPLSDIPLLQAMNPLGFQESKILSYPETPVEHFDLHAPTPELPPLPPLQWRVTKPRSDALDSNTLDLTSSFSDYKNHGSISSHPTKPAADVKTNAGSEPMNATVTKKQLDEQKVKVHVLEKMSQAANRRVDEREDFLHQIRGKSFNLRKTGLLKSSPTTDAPVSNVKVTAILEKAKTIRQVMNDGEDDDPWSDA